MRVLFIGVGLTDYVNQQLNKLNQKVEVYNLVDADGVGHVPVGTHQSRKGISFKVVELPGIVRHKYSDNSYWSFAGLSQALSDIKPEIIVVSDRYIRTLMYDPSIASVIREVGTKIVLKENPFRLEKYNVRKEKIIAGLVDEEYTPFYVLYFLRIFERLGFKDVSFIKN